MSSNEVHTYSKQHKHQREMRDKPETYEAVKQHLIITRNGGGSLNLILAMPAHMQIWRVAVQLGWLCVSHGASITPEEEVTITGI